MVYFLSEGLEVCWESFLLRLSSGLLSQRRIGGLLGVFLVHKQLLLCVLAEIMCLGGGFAVCYFNWLVK